MTRKEVKNYIRLNFKVYGNKEFNIDNAINNIIEVVADAWFFSWPNFALGMIIGGIIVLIFK